MARFSLQVQASTARTTTLRSPATTSTAPWITAFGGGDGIEVTDAGNQNYAADLALQSDGKILVTGRSWNGSSFEILLARYNSDGSLDTSFGGGDGLASADVGANDDYAGSVTVQVDGKILVAGYSNNGTDFDFALVRFNSDGTLDTGFGGGDGMVTTAIGAQSDQGHGVAVQADGKIVVAGYTSNGSNIDFAITRYNADGTLDTSFGGGDGIATYDSGAADFGFSVAIQSDGKILAGGRINGDFAILRFDTNGTLDTSFGGGDGVATTNTGSSDFGESITLQPDGKILLAGYGYNGSDDDVALLRYNSDGTLDTSFGGGDGIVTTAIGAGHDRGHGVAVHSDGKILVGGSSHNGADYDFALVRYNSDGSLDTTFNLQNTLDGTPTFTEGGPAVVLDADVDVSDAELDALNGGAGNYDGASLTIARSGGASAEDVLGFNDGNGITLVGGSLIKNSQIIATFDTTTTTGELVVSFTDANGEIPTSADVDIILRQITYANASDAPPGGVVLDWTFDDGNTGAQGTGGALQAIGATTVTITAANDAPTFMVGDGVQTVDISSDDDYGSSVAIQSDGKILVTGYRFNGSDNDVVLSRFNADGTLDTTFNGTGVVILDVSGDDDDGHSVTVQSDGKILVSGSATIGGVQHAALFRFNTDGSLDTSFGGGDGYCDDVGRHFRSRPERNRSVRRQNPGCRFQLKSGQ